MPSDRNNPTDPRSGFSPRYSQGHIESESSDAEFTESAVEPSSADEETEVSESYLSESEISLPESYLSESEISLPKTDTPKSHSPTNRRKKTSHPGSDHDRYSGWKEAIWSLALRALRIGILASGGILALVLALVIGDWVICNINPSLGTSLQRQTPVSYIQGIKQGLSAIREAPRSLETASQRPTFGSEKRVIQEGLSVQAKVVDLLTIFESYLQYPDVLEAIKHYANSTADAFTSSEIKRTSRAISLLAEKLKSEVEDFSNGFCTLVPRVLANNKLLLDLTDPDEIGFGIRIGYSGRLDGLNKDFQEMLSQFFTQLQYVVQLQQIIVQGPVALNSIGDVIQKGWSETLLGPSAASENDIFIEKSAREKLKELAKYLEPMNESIEAGRNKIRSIRTKVVDLGNFIQDYTYNEGDLELWREGAKQIIKKIEAAHHSGWKKKHQDWLAEMERMHKEVAARKAAGMPGKRAAGMPGKRAAWPRG